MGSKKLKHKRVGKFMADLSEVSRKHGICIEADADFQPWFRELPKGPGYYTCYVSGLLGHCGLHWKKKK